MDLYEVHSAAITASLAIMARRALLVVALLALVCVVVALEHHKRAEPNAWFAHLEHHSPPPSNNQVAHAHEAMCCHTLSFQESVEGEWSGRTAVPFDHWLESGKVRLGVAYHPDEQVAPGLELAESGLILDGTRASEAYLRIQCSYPCCLESMAMLRPESDPYAPLVSAASLPSGIERDANSLKPIGWYRGAGRGLTSEHFWGEPHVDQSLRRRELDVCDANGEGIYVRINLSQRREYAISEIDLCFLDADLGHEDVNSWCHEEAALWSILEEQNRD